MVNLIGLDVGGANVKLAHSAGPVRSVAFALWKDPGRLASVLSEAAADLPPFERVRLTMTAELCDCFETKRQGVAHVLDAVTTAFPECRVAVWGTDGRFHSTERIRTRPVLAAASNWLALATVAAALAEGRPGVLIDVGSTTTDLIPFRQGAVTVRGRTDTERLQTGELIYAGVRRTPVVALAESLPFRGVPTGLAAEWFATTLDVNLILGTTPEDPFDHDTANGRPATIGAARDRLSRMVGADREEFTAADALDFARAADAALFSRLNASLRRVGEANGGRTEVAVVAGSGEFLARRLAQAVITNGTVLSLSELWGSNGSSAACARALLELTREVTE